MASYARAVVPLSCSLSMSPGTWLCANAWLSVVTFKFGGLHATGTGTSTGDGVGAHAQVPGGSGGPRGCRVARLWSCEDNRGEKCIDPSWVSFPLCGPLRPSPTPWAVLEPSKTMLTWAWVCCHGGTVEASVRHFETSRGLGVVDSFRDLKDVGMGSFEGFVGFSEA
jgi:hypothetical protein